MPQYLFDIETDGLLPELTKIHSIVLQEVTSKQVISCCDSGGELSILEGVRLLHDADLLIGHNILNFDLPAIAKLYPWFSYCGKQVRDTLLYSRLLFPDLFDRDMRVTSHPRNLLGSHGLEAWGHRLNLHKGDYQKEMNAKGLTLGTHGHPKCNPIVFRM